MPTRPLYFDETSRLHKVIRNEQVRVSYTDHAKERMIERQVDRMDVRRILETGTVETVDLRSEEVWNVRGKDLDERTLVVACVVYEDLIRIKIVTVFPRD